MKVNDLTEEDLNRGDYVIFNENSLVQEVVNVFYNARNELQLDFNSVQGNWIVSLGKFKSSPNFKDCEMFPIESIKKPE